MITLGIIEDQQAIREALCSYLGEQPDIDCVLSVGSVSEFAEQLDGLVAKPTLVLSDIGLPVLSGIEGLALWQQRLPDAAVVMLSIHTDAERVFEALRAGAVGYLDKMTPLPMLAELLRQVAAGGSPMSPSVARHVIRHLWPARQPTDTTLTPREKEIVRGIEDGLSYKLIADRLSVSIDTVRTHIRQIYRKLHVNSKAEIISRSWARSREAG
ncbi:LuxR C-terminal-related transcriptional regulator [Hymenobacter polaris]|nr:response regulator transcription factor [Hymenobacter polaris]